MRPVLVTTSLVISVVISCAPPWPAPYRRAVEADRRGEVTPALTAYQTYLEGPAKSPFKETARQRLRLLLLEQGARQLVEERWLPLSETGQALQALRPVAPEGALYQAVSAAGQGQTETARVWLAKTRPEMEGIDPADPAAQQATALLLFSGSLSAAKVALRGSLAQAGFLRKARERLQRQLARQEQDRQRRAALAEANTPEAWAALLDEYPGSSEARKAADAYGAHLAARLASARAVGPPTASDPDPLTTLVREIRRRLPEHKVALAALAGEEQLRQEWSELHEKQLEKLRAGLATAQAAAAEQIVQVIVERCLPLRGSTDAEGQAALAAARQVAAQLIPHGLTGPELTEVAHYVHANCGPATVATGQ